jgi:hypothetical protein
LGIVVVAVAVGVVVAGASELHSILWFGWVFLHIGHKLGERRYARRKSCCVRASARCVHKSGGSSHPVVGGVELGAEHLDKPSGGIALAHHGPIRELEIQLHRPSLLLFLRVRTNLMCSAAEAG